VSTFVHDIPKSCPGGILTEPIPASRRALYLQVLADQYPETFITAIKRPIKLLLSPSSLSMNYSLGLARLAENAARPSPFWSPEKVLN